MGLAPDELILSPELAQEFFQAERKTPDETYQNIPRQLSAYLGNILCNQARDYREADDGKIMTLGAPYNVLARPEDQSEATYPLIRIIVNSLTFPPNKYSLTSEDFIVHAVNKKISHRSQVVEALQIPNGGFVFPSKVDHPPRIDRRNRNEAPGLADLVVHMNNQYEAQEPNITFNVDAWQALFNYMSRFHDIDRLPISHLEISHRD